MDDFFEQSTQFDGILGLAFQNLAEDKVLPPLLNAINQGILDQPLFMVALYEKGFEDNVAGRSEKILENLRKILKIIENLKKLNF